MAELSIIIPVFNEERAIQKTVHEIQNALKRVKSPSEIILVNDGSTDTTPAILKKISGVRVLMHGKNKGYGAALKTGICHASGKWILIVDADGTYPIDAIPTLLKDTAKFDMVVGSRTGENVHIPFFRRPAKWFLNRLVYLGIWARYNILRLGGGSAPFPTAASAKPTLTGKGRASPKEE